MKTKLQLLLIAIFATQFASAQFYLNEVMVSPGGADSPNEYIEIRGAANANLDNMYVLAVDGNGDDPGDIDEVLDLSGLTLGSNGLLVVLTTGHPYSVGANTTIALDLSSGDINSQSHTFFLISSPTTPSSSDDIDDNDDGTPDSVDSNYSDWTVFDSVSLLSDSGDSAVTAYAYSTVVFLENNESTTPTVFSPPGAVIASTPGTQFDYAGRIGNSTGFSLTADAATSDWVGGDLTGSAPNYLMNASSGNMRALPQSFEASELNHVGSANPALNSNAPTIYLNEILANPPGTDTAFEYIEIKGTPGTTLDDVYIVTIEGDGANSDTPGDINKKIDLSGQTIGANGYLVLVQTAHTYTIDPAANVATVLDGVDFESQSHTFLLVYSPHNPSTSDDIDTNNDGVPNIDIVLSNSSPYEDWSVLDRFSFLRDDSESATSVFSYSNIGFLENNEATTPALFPVTATSIISTAGTQFEYAARIATSTGATLTSDETTSDWMGGDLKSTTTTDGNGNTLWELSTNATGVRAYPEYYEGSFLDHIGSENPTPTTLSTSSFELNNNTFKIYPNPASDVITIASNAQDKVSTAQVFDLLGKQVIKTEVKNNTINVTSLSQGLYVVKINTVSGKSLTKKIIIE